MRKLIDGSEVEEFQFPVKLEIKTKAPGKWKFMDLETGQEYLGSNVVTKYGKWIRMDK